MIYPLSLPILEILAAFSTLNRTAKMMRLGVAGCALVILFAVLLFMPMLRSMFPGLVQGFSNYDCKRETQCPEGTFCQSDQCIPIVTNEMTNSAGATGYYA